MRISACIPRSACSTCMVLTGALDQPHAQCRPASAPSGPSGKTADFFKAFLPYPARPRPVPVHRPSPALICRPCPGSCRQLFGLPFALPIRANIWCVHVRATREYPCRATSRHRSDQVAASRRGPGRCKPTRTPERAPGG